MRYIHPPTWCGHLRRRGEIYEVNWDMKPIVIISAAALFSSLITVSTTTAAALSCDCGDICMSNKQLVE